MAPTRSSAGGRASRWRPSRPLVRLAASLLVLDFGASMTQVALPLLVVSRYGLDVASALALALPVAPGIVLAGLVGGIVDRRDPRRVAVLSSLASAAVVVLVPFTTELWQVSVLALAIGLSAPFGFPARMALRPAVIPQGEEVRGNALIVSGERLTSLIGPLLSGPIIALGSISTLFFVEGGTALVAAGLLLGLPAPPVETREQGATHPPTAGRRRLTAVLITPLVDFARLLRRDGVVAALSYTALFYVGAVAAGRIFLIAYAAEHHGSGSGMFGVFIAALAAGGVVGGFVGGRVAGVRQGRLYIVANVLEGLCWPLIALSGSPVGAIAMLVVAGVLESVATVVYFAEVQARLPASFTGRYYALLTPLTGATTVAGTLLGGALVPATGPEAAAVAIGLLMALPVLALARPLGRAGTRGGVHAEEAGAA